MTFVADSTIFTFALEHAVHISRDDDECSGGAYEQGVNVDSECLNKALLCWVRNFCCGSVLRTSTLTSFIGVDTAANTPHDSDAQHASKSSVQVECGGENQTEYFRNVLVINEQNDKRNNDVDGCHEWNHHGSKRCNTLYTADNNNREDDCQSYTGDGGADAPSIFNSRRNTVGLNAWKEVCSCQNHRDCEDNTVNQHEWSSLGVGVRLFNVVSRTTAVLTGILVLLFIDLSKCTFDKRRCGAQQCHGPHPKNRAWATESNSGCNTRDVANTNASRQ